MREQSEQFPGNPYVNMYGVANGEVEDAVLALAYEQRTANLIAFLAHATQSGGNGAEMRRLHKQVVERLGLERGES